MKNILINIKTKNVRPKSVLRWEFASVYIEWQQTSHNYSQQNEASRNFRYYFKYLR